MKIASLYTRLKHMFSRGIKVDSIITNTFSNRWEWYSNVGQLYECPMESGKIGLLRLYDVKIWISHDCGASLYYEFIRYIKE